MQNCCLNERMNFNRKKNSDKIIDEILKSMKSLHLFQITSLLHRHSAKLTWQSHKIYCSFTNVFGSNMASSIMMMLEVGKSLHWES